MAYTHIAPVNLMDYESHGYLVWDKAVMQFMLDQGGYNQYPHPIGPDKPLTRFDYLELKDEHGT